MAKVYTDFDRVDMDLYNEVMATYHQDLLMVDVKIKPVLVKKVDKHGEVSPCLKLGGYAVAGLARVTTHKQRFLGYPDGLIEIDGAGWANKPPETRKALIDHELHHFVVKRDPDSDNPNAPLLDDLGRPKLELRPDDFFVTGFYCVAERHGEFAGEYQSIKTIHLKIEEAARRFSRSVAS